MLEEEERGSEKVYVGETETETEKEEDGRWKMDVLSRPARFND